MNDINSAIIMAAEAHKGQLIKDISIDISSFNCILYPYLGAEAGT